MMYYIDKPIYLLSSQIDLLLTFSRDKEGALGSCDMCASKIRVQEKWMIHKMSNSRQGLVMGFPRQLII